MESSCLCYHVATSTEGCDDANVLMRKNGYLCVSVQCTKSKTEFAVITFQYITSSLFFLLIKSQF